MEFVAIEHLPSIHSLDFYFFLWWWGHTSDKSPLNQIPGSLPGSVKRNSSGKTKSWDKTSHKYGRTIFVRWVSIVLMSTQLYQTGLVRVSEFHASFSLRSLHSFSLFDKTTIIFNYGTFAIGFLFLVCCLSLFFFFLSRTLHTANERASVPEWWVGINQRSTSYPEHLDSSRQCVPHLHVVA